jgi:hypothetical protein
MTTLLGHALEQVAAFLRSAGVWWGLAISVVLAVGSLLGGVAVVVSWHPDHFKDSHLRRLLPGEHPVVRGAAIGAKNVAGVVLLLLGMVMALPGIPGQGILTMIIGLTLIDFPGKRRLERRLIGRPAVLRRLNNLRARFHRARLELD